jgi:hypothetical protein
MQSKFFCFPLKSEHWTCFGWVYLTMKPTHLVLKFVISMLDKQVGWIVKLALPPGVMLMDHLHWRHLLSKPLATATGDIDCTCLGHLGRCDTD